MSPETGAPWHELSAEQALARLGSDAAAGLAADEWERRLGEHGPNELVERGGRSPSRILWDQLTGTMILVLVAAAAISAWLGDFKDAAAIGAIVVLNTLLGFSQEYRAEKAMAALKRLNAPNSKVRRAGHVMEVSSRELVPGDILLVETGSYLAADGRLFEAVRLKVQEAALTGESEPVDKTVEALRGGGLALGDRRNMVYRGTLVVYGRGEAVVTESGMRTELGRITSLIADAGHEPTPLQRRLDQLGRRLAAAALVIVAAVFAFGMLRGEELKLMLLTSISLAVAAIPEGLPAVVTIALALGSQRMLKRRVLIRKLPAVETLGSVTVICSDKTGTLTEGRMTATVLEAVGRRTDLAASAPLQRAEAGLLMAAALCSDASMEASNEGPRLVGEPTEAALVGAAHRRGLDRAELARALPRVGEVPFDPQRKRMTTLHRRQGPLTGAAEGLKSLMDSPFVSFTKGAVEGLVELSTSRLGEAGVEPLTPQGRRGIAAAHQDLARQGMRILGVAYRRFEAAPGDADAAALERELTFIGLVGLIDPPRAQARAAVERCRAAGIRPVMITGDHPLTAQAIAEQLGLASAAPVLTGREIERLSQEELEARARQVSVYARVAPEHKLRIVQALQKRGHYVAMTGDGVNDAPALKKADIGIAMGITGTDAAKEAADMVLLDDDFAAIVAAVEEGRVIYDNIRKFLKYLVTTNSAEVLVMAAGPVLGMPLPLLPLQILWINLVTDGPTALALSLEPAEQDVMRRGPRSPSESLFGRGLGLHALWVGPLITVVSLGTGYGFWAAGRAEWRTMVFTTMAFAQMAHVLAIRSERLSLFQMGVLSNPGLLAAVAATIALQLAVVYVPGLRAVFSTEPLDPRHLLCAAAAASSVFAAVELEKLLKRRATARSRPGRASA